MSKATMFRRPIPGSTGDHERVRLDGSVIEVSGGGRTVRYARESEAEARAMYKQMLKDCPEATPAGERLADTGQDDALRFENR